MATLIYSKPQQNTIARLEKKDFDTIKQADITRLLSKVLDNKPASEKYVPIILDYEKTKFPNKSSTDLEKYLLKKIKGKSDRVMFREVISDQSSFPDPQKPKAGSTVTESLPSGDFTSFNKPTKTSGSDSTLNDLLDRLLDNKTETETKTPARFQGEGIRMGGDTKTSIGGNAGSLDWSSFFKTGSQTYKDNKQLIDKFKSSVSAEKIADGSWFTSLSSMEAPELEILQQVINLTPLGFSKSDKDQFTDMLSRDKSKMGNVSTADGLKILGKLLVNPDQIGNLLSTRASQITADASEGLGKFFNKVTGIKAPTSKDIGSLQDLIDARRGKASTDSKRRSDLDDLMGVTKPAPVNTGTADTSEGRIIGGTGSTKIGNFQDIESGQAMGDQSKMTAEQILTPPPIPGFTESTAGQDFMGFLKNLVVPDFSAGGDQKEKFLDKLKQTDPDSFNRYQAAMDTYNKTKKKLALTLGSDIDLSIHKDDVLRAFNFTRDLLKKASSLKALTNDQIEQIYDISGTLDSVLKGGSTITYEDLDKIQKSIFSQIPKKLTGTPEFTKYVDEIKTSLGSKFSGDSMLSTIAEVDTDSGSDASTDIDTDVDTKVDDYSKDEDEKDDQPPKDKPPITETELDIGGSSKPDTEESSWSELRPRLKYGGTDEMFYRTKENVNMGNLIAEAKGVDQAGWGNGSDSTLYKRNLIVDQMRYGMTFGMPKVQRAPSQVFPKSFVGLQEPMWTTKNAQVPIERSIDETTGKDAFNQFLQFSPAYPETTYGNLNQLQTPQYYPYRRNMSHEDQELQATNFNYIQNSRWTKR